MAVVNVLDTDLTNINAGTLAMPGARYSGSRLRTKEGVITVSNTDSIASTYRFFRVRSSDLVVSLKLYNAALTGVTDADLGLYGIANGAAVDADVYLDGATLATAAPAVPPTAASDDGMELRFGDAATSTPGFIKSKVWQDLALAADPQLEYDVTLTINAAATATGLVGLRMIYTDGS